MSLHFLAKMGIMVLTDIERSDVGFICKTLGCSPIAHIDQLASKSTVVQVSCCVVTIVVVVVIRDRATFG